MEAVTDVIFLGSKNTVDCNFNHEIKRQLLLARKADKPRQCIKKQRHHFGNKGVHIQNYGFSSSRVWMCELDHKEGWAMKNWYLQSVLEKIVESPLDSKEIKPDNPKGTQLWISFGGTDAEAEIPILWPPDMKSWLTGKDPGAGKDWSQKEKTVAEDEMVR